jgi:hypothetical protein
MPYVGIVGLEAAKFTDRTERVAREIIRALLAPPDAILVSGACPLGGVDIFAAEEADGLGREKVIYPPKSPDWYTGYRPRNERIALRSDVVHCITVASYDLLPESYSGRRWQTTSGAPFCYHCKERNEPHVKSGGCWTAWRCSNEREWWIIR